MPFVYPIVKIPECQSTKMTWVSECPSALRVPECLKCSSTQVLMCLKCLSVQVPWGRKCPCSVLRVPKCPLTALRVEKTCDITENGLFISVIEFYKNFSKYMFYITPIVFYFLRNNMCQFYQVLLTWSFKGVSNTFVKFHKIKYDGLQSSLFSDIVVILLL